MHREIVEIGFFKIQSYGLMLALGFLAGGILLLRAARKRSLSEDLIVNLIYIIVLSSVVGSRLMYVLTHLSDYAGDPLEIFKIWEGGLTLYGGLLLAVVAAVAYMKRVGLPVLVVCDLAAPSIALGAAFARVGCFLNGCCFGLESDLPWAVEFPPGCQAGSVLPGVALHPTQIYSVALSLAVLAVLAVMGRRNLRPGALFWSFLLMDSAARFALGFVRYTEPSAWTMPLGALTLNVNQLIAAALGLASALALAGARSRRR